MKTISFASYVPADRAYAANGLNQYASVAGTAYAYDANGNLTSDGTYTYTYDAENRLVASSRSGGTTLAYDPLGRLWQTSSAVHGTTQYLYDGDRMAVEYDAAGAVLRRYAWGPGTDEPILQDEGSTPDCTGTRFLHTDHQGSIVATADCAGTRLNVNTHDEYGVPGTSNWGRFQYTGQAWLPELGMYYYKARIYAPLLGRFMQTDPIGYDDQVNLYAYVGNDPVNGTDPSGMSGCGSNTPRDAANCTSIQVGEPNPASSRSSSTPSVQPDTRDSQETSTEASPQNVQVSVPTYADANGDIVVTATRTISVHQKWVLAGGGYHLNPYYVDPYPWLNLENFLSVQIGAFATAGAVAGAPALAGRMATSRTFGVSSSRFGNSFYRGGAGQGSSNHGSARLGWSFNARTGNVYFQGRVGNYHIPTPIFTPAP